MTVRQNVRISDGFFGVNAGVLQYSKRITRICARFRGESGVNWDVKCLRLGLRCQVSGVDPSAGGVKANGKPATRKKTTLDLEENRR